MIENNELRKLEYLILLKFFLLLVHVIEDFLKQIHLHEYGILIYLILFLFEFRFYFYLNFQKILLFYLVKDFLFFDYVIIVILYNFFFPLLNIFLLIIHLCIFHFLVMDILFFYLKNQYMNLFECNLENYLFQYLIKFHLNHLKFFLLLFF